MPTPTQKTFRTVYAASFLIIAHHESRIASVVLNAQTKRNGLWGPSQLTNEKLKILISTPIISMDRMFTVTNLFNLLTNGRFIFEALPFH